MKTEAVGKLQDLYTTIHLERGAKLAKMDIHTAYRIIPVHPHDRCLSGMRWEGQLFIDAALPVGLRSAPKLFTAVADAPEWVVKSKGVRFLSITLMTL